MKIISEKSAEKPKVIISIFIFVSTSFFGCHPEGNEPTYGRELDSANPYGMEIVSVHGNPDAYTITTTGARYILKQTEMELWRRIDPATNSYHLRKVAVLEFPTDIGKLALSSQDGETAKIRCPTIDFTIHADSFFFVQANQSFSYKHRNLIENTPWSKPNPDQMRTGLNRMWTDGYGGSLHCYLRGKAKTTQIQSDSTTFAMQAGGMMGHMLYPPKLFNFPKLYGTNSRPFVFFLYSKDHLKKVLQNWQYYENLGFGVFVLWNDLYQKFYIPTPLESDQVKGGIVGYRFNKEAEPWVSFFIQRAHNRKCKVISYLRSPYLKYHRHPLWMYPPNHPQAGQHQPYTVTLEHMKHFQQKYHLDGWYLDNADAGTLLEDYHFIKQLRRDVDRQARSNGFDTGVLFHHCTNDALDARVGNFNSIMINAYVDYILWGEWDRPSWIDHPNDPHLRFYSSGYGMSQAFGSHKRATRMKLALSEAEKNRILADLNGAERAKPSTLKDFVQSFLPAYRKRKADYVSGNFKPDVQWPVDEKTGWFRAPENITIHYPGPKSAVVRWRTNELATSEVTYSSSGHWWPSDYQSAPDGIVSDKSMVFDHTITIRNLEPKKNYEFRIRSYNGKSDTEEIIWGYKFGLDSDRDGLPDEWENKYFKNLNQRGDQNPDSDSNNNLLEWQQGTNPTVSDRTKS